jgi:putative transposase
VDSLSIKEKKRMKRRFSEEQIIGILKQQESGVKTADVCREHNISTNTFYTWKSKYGGMNVSEAQRLRQLEAENSKLKRIVAEQAMDNIALKDLLSKNW